jgi:nitronate monooxygenase
MAKWLPWNRREFLKAGAATTAIALGCANPVTAPAGRSGRLRFHTPLCDLLGIEYPIIQSGMGGVGGPELTAAVSRAGGLGILAGAHLPPDDIRRRIHEVRRLCDGPFGVNLLLHTDMWPPVDASRIPDSVVQAAQHALSRFRERLALAPAFTRPATRADHIPGAIEVILEERVPVFSIGLGNPPADLVARFHAQGAKVIAMAATVADAREVAASGVDAVVVQGHEAGGHRSTWVKRPSAEHAHIGTMTLVPQVVEAIDVPVVAAGGIATGRGLVAALALGAQGVLLGTRFVATRESLARDFYKHELVARDSDSTTVTDAYSGLYARVLRNTFTTEYGASDAPVLPGFLQGVAARDIIGAAEVRRDRDYYPMWAGQSVGMVNDIPSAADVVAALVGEAHAVMRGLPENVRTS